VLPDSPAFVATFLGALRIGAIAVTLSTYLTRDEYAYLLADSGARIAVIDPATPTALPGGGTTFALAFSGRDGSLVMRVEESGKSPQQTGGRTRSLVVTPALGGGGWLVGGDPSGTGLRAVELPKGSVKTASK